MLDMDASRAVRASAIWRRASGEWGRDWGLVEEEGGLEDEGGGRGWDWEGAWEGIWVAEGPEAADVGADMVGCGFDVG
jgi:hypothetical protein